MSYRKLLACGGKGPCCHIGYAHRHCEHCDTVIATYTYPVYPTYPITWWPYGSHPSTRWAHGAWQTNTGDSYPSMPTSIGATADLLAVNSATAQATTAFSAPAEHVCEVTP